MPVKQELEHLLAAAKRLKPFFNNRFEQVPVVPTGGIVVETLVGHQFGFADILGKALPLVVQHCEYNPTIASLKQTARRGARTMAPGGAGVVIAIGEQILQKKDVVHLKDAFVKRHVDILSDSCAFTVIQRCE